MAFHPKNGKMMPNTNKKISLRLKMRDVSYAKPKGYENYLTVTEVSRAVKKDVSWLKRLEREKRIPVAHRVKSGALSVRLWSPQQVTEITDILAQMRRGRPKGS